MPDNEGPRLEWDIWFIIGPLHLILLNFVLWMTFFWLIIAIG